MIKPHHFSAQEFSPSRYMLLEHGMYVKKEFKDLAHYPKLVDYSVVYLTPELTLFGFEVEGRYDHFVRVEGSNSLYVVVYYKGEIPAIVGQLEEIPEFVTEGSKVGTVYGSSGGMYIEWLDYRKELGEVDCEMSSSYEELRRVLEGEGSGIVLLAGPPGTGKSTMIKKLISDVNRKFVLMPTSMAKNLSDPNIMGFLTVDLVDTVLVIEDAEEVLIDRQLQFNSAASTLLNVTDGILGDLVKLKVLCTVNTEDTIDKALLRKGRMLKKVDFKPLPPDKADRLLVKLGKEPLGKAMTLAEIYGNDNGVVDEKRKIGF